MHRTIRTLLCLVAPLLGANGAAAQATAPDGITLSDRRELINNKDWHFVGHVELELRDTKVYAEEVWFYSEEHRAVATGNVVFTQGNNRIAADRAEVDTQTRLGTFYNATGIANIQPAPQRAPVGGVVVPPLAGQETDVYFFGEVIEKIGPKKYRISNGGFTTCVQPTPRWNLHADTVILNIDRYTLLRQAVLKVKGVPLLYVPLLYYPTNEEARATGFLLPTYGMSTVRGQTISNAFFWAIDRSQDATIMHDWFSKTGQGLGSEYRYTRGGGSDGNARMYMLDQREATYALGNGGTGTEPARRSFEIQGGATQLLPLGLRVRARANYFSSLTTIQTFSTNVYEASRNQRSYGGNVAGAWGTYSLNGTFDRSELFYGTESSVVTGNSPRVAFSRGERPLFARSPLYFAVGSEFVQLERQSRSGGVVHDSGLARIDFTPQVRYPFKRWQWFTVNSSVTWRNTYYSRSKVLATPTAPERIGDDNLNRRYFTFLAQTVGPVFNRVWNTPDNGYAERFKHTIEPFINLQRTSSIDNYDRIVATDGADTVLGNATSYTYGVRNRFYAKRRLGQISQAQEIASVELTQTYYTDQRSAQYDQQYATSFSGAPPSHFSPAALNVRVMPTVNFSTTLRAEFDGRERELRTLSASGNYNWTGRLQTSVGWSQRYFIENLPGFNNPDALDHYLNVSANAHTDDNRFGGIFSFNYDVLRSTMLQQRLTGFYNAQCCGIAFEYQTFNFAVGSLAVPSDHRFFLSFTLAGLGNFSPFNGAMGAVPR